MGKFGIGPNERIAQIWLPRSHRVPRGHWQSESQYDVSASSDDDVDVDEVDAGSSTQAIRARARETSRGKSTRLTMGPPPAHGCAPRDDAAPPHARPSSAPRSPPLSRRA